MLWSFGQVISDNLVFIQGKESQQLKKTLLYYSCLVMNLSCLLSLLKEVPAYRQLVEGLVSAKGEHKVIVLDAAKPYLIAALHEELNRPLIVITAQPEGAKKLHEQLQAWCPPSANLHGFPELDFSPYEYSVSYPSNTMVERLQALATLAFYEPFASCHSERVSRSPERSEGEESHSTQDRLREAI